jgi:hypothetical protein
LLIDRTELGEEVTSDFAEDILQLVETWNDCVGSLREQAREVYEQYIHYIRRASRFNAEEVCVTSTLL